MATHAGQWADSHEAAISQALAEVGIGPGDYLEIVYSMGMRYEPIVPDGRSAVSVEVVFSEARQQYKATLRQVMAAEPLDEDGLVDD